MSQRSGLRPFSDVPRARLHRVLRQIAASGGGRKDMRSQLEVQYRERGPIVSQLRGPFRMVNLYGADANRFVLLDRDGIFSARIPWMRIMGRIFPNGLLLRDGLEHKHHRKIMHEAFKRPVLRDYTAHMNPMVSEGIGGWARSEPIHAFPAFKRLTLDIATRIFLGVDLGPSAEPMNTAFEDMVAASMSRVRLPWRRLEFGRGLAGREYMLKFLSSLLVKKRRDQGGDMFSRLVRAESEEGDTFADRDVLDHMIFLMMAAHDTTTSTLTSLTYELGKHPEWQERVREECRALGSESAAYDDGDALPSLARVLNETLRRYPPLPVIPRVATQAFEWEGYSIPADTMVVVSPIHTHYMSEWWSEPDRFDPERFSPERAEERRHTHSWLPFGGGPHMCIGRRFAEAQIRCVVHQLVLRYRWRLPDSYRMPIQQAPISKPLDGLPVHFEAI